MKSISIIEVFSNVKAVLDYMNKTIAIIHLATL